MYILFRWTDRQDEYYTSPLEGEGVAVAVIVW
jgi:hypothetical protein